MIDELPLPNLHAKVMSTYYSCDGCDNAHEAFYCLLKTYQYNTRPERFTELAEVCDLRMQRDTLPIDLIAAYNRLARLARWRAEQLRRQAP